MSQETRPRRFGPSPSDDPFELGAYSKSTSSRSVRRSQHSISPSLGRGSESFSRFPSVNSELSGDNPKITMRTRVTVRDKTPHRFQVVPLREVGKLGIQGEPESGLLSVPVRPKHHHVPPSPSGGRIGPYTQSRTLQPSVSITSLETSAAKHEPQSWAPWNSTSPPATSSYYNLQATPRSSEYSSPRQVLIDLDPNRRHPTSTNMSSNAHSVHRPLPGVSPAFRQTDVYSSSQSSLQNGSQTKSRFHQTIPQPYLSSTYPGCPNTSKSFTHTLAPALELSSDTQKLHRQRIPPSEGSKVAKARPVQGPRQHEPRPERRNAIYHDSMHLFPLINQKIDSDPAASDTSDAGSSSSRCGSPPSSRSQRLDKELTSKPDYLHSVTRNVVSNVPRKGILKTSLESLPRKAATIKASTMQLSLTSRCLSTRPLKLSKSLNKRRTIVGSQCSDPPPHPQIILDLLQEIDVLIRDWEVIL